VDAARRRRAGFDTAPKIEPIADDEHVRNFETDIVGLDGRTRRAALLSRTQVLIARV